MEPTPALAAIVDDDAQSRRALARLFGSMNYTTLAYATGEAFLAPDTPIGFDCILLDYHFTGLGGLDLLRKVRARHAGAVIAVITALERPGMRRACLSEGAASFLTKPIGDGELLHLLRIGARR